VENRENKIRGLVYILFTIMENTNKHLMEEEAFLNLPKSTMGEIIMEFLIFNLHQFNRTLYAWFGEEERNELMDGILIELQDYLKQKNKEELDEKYANLTIDSFGDYLDELTFKSILDDFYNFYNKRETEYANYMDNPKKGEGLAGTLLWEFGNKIAKIMNREKDLIIITKVQFLGAEWTHFADAMKKLLLENGRK